MRASSPFSGVRVILLTNFLILSTILGTLTARVLEDIPQNAVPPGGQGPEGGELSKGQINPSSPRKYGSETGDTTPTGTVQMPPSATSTSLSSDSSNTSTPNGSSYYSTTSAVTTTQNSTFHSRQNTSETVWESSSGTTSGGGGMANNVPFPPGFPNMFPSPPPF